MYEVDASDHVQPLLGIPQCDVGAPEPVVVADEGAVVVAYYASSPEDWNTGEPEDFVENDVVVLRFRGVHSMLFGAPNDEALHGHPLAERGLGPYAAYRIENSSWVRRLERMNRVHERHDPDGFSRLSHIVLTFHDSTFECVCGSPPEVSRVPGVTPRDAAVASQSPQG